MLSRCMDGWRHFFIYNFYVYKFWFGQIIINFCENTLEYINCPWTAKYSLILPDSICENLRTTLLAVVFCLKEILYNMWLYIPLTSSSLSALLIGGDIRSRCVAIVSGLLPVPSFSSQFTYTQWNNLSTSPTISLRISIPLSPSTLVD